MNIAVYLASKSGNLPHIIEQTQLLGAWIGKNHHALVYGGSNTGLMYTIARSTKGHGGKVIGIEMSKFHNEGCSFSECDEFVVTETLSERKEKMMKLSDAFIALPGGIGTLDEISEIMAVDKIGGHHRPIILMNIDGFYDDLKHQLEKMVSYGYLLEEEKNRIHFVEDVDELNVLFQ